MTPPTESPHSKLDNHSPEWTTLHKQAADVSIRNCILTPPQEGSGERGAPGVDMNARGPVGMTAFALDFLVRAVVRAVMATRKTGTTVERPLCRTC